MQIDRRFFVAAGLLAMLKLRNPNAAFAEPPPLDWRSIVEANNAFAFRLYQQLAAGDSNQFFSGYSISTALAMAYAGARGGTAEEMARTLSFAADQARFHPIYRQMLNQVKQVTGPYELHVANALWVQRGYPLLPPFVETLERNYTAAPRQLDFQSATEAARQEINHWVESQTKEKIKDLLKPGILTDLTRLVLTNAIYFKALWEDQFNKDSTRDQEFTLAGGAKVKTPMMRQGRRLPYMETDQYQLLEVPYQHRALSLLAFLPKKTDGLAALEKTLTAEEARRAGDKLEPYQVDLSLPRFKVTAEFKLNEVLSALGMPTAFSAARADFSGIDGRTGRDGLYLSAVVHKAYVDVNEGGTEAAAATAGVIAARSAVPDRTRAAVFRADHPFLFLIRHNDSGSILFHGRVTNPAS